MTPVLNNRSHLSHAELQLQCNVSVLDRDTKHGLGQLVNLLSNYNLSVLNVFET